MARAPRPAAKCWRRRAGTRSRPWPAARALVGGDHEPQHQQRRCDRCGADDGGKGGEEVHRYGKYAIFSGYLRLRNAEIPQPQVYGKFARSGASPAQQPRQIFFSRAFISASSAPIVSTYFELSTFEVLQRAAALRRPAPGAAAGTLSRPAGRAARPCRSKLSLAAASADRFAIRRLGDGGLRQRANRDDKASVSFRPLSLAGGTRP